MAKGGSGPLLMGAQYLTLGNGGIAVCARMTAAALANRNPMSALACLDTGDFSIGKVPVRTFGGSRLKFSLQLAMSARRSTCVFYDFLGTARAHQVMRFHDRPYAVWAHGVEVWEAMRPDYQRALERADLVLVHSAYTQERGARWFKGAKTVRLCPLATDIDEEPSRQGPSDGPPVVLVLGRIDEKLGKGHDVLISLWPKVASAVPGARLVFAGGGNRTEHIRALAASSSAAASIDVLGFVPVARIAGLWDRASVFAMPSLAEGFGLVYVEAMRRGIPVLASREDAGQEVNADGVSGYNVSRRRPDEMADALVALLRDRDLARRLGEGGHRRWREHYTFSSFERRLQAATASLVAA